MLAITLALMQYAAMTQKLNSGLGELLRHLTELVDRGADIAYREKSLDYRPRYTPLMRVLAGGGCSVNEITTRLAITQGAVSQTIKLMMADDLVKRSAGSDARQSIISLTDHGKRLLSKLQPHWRATFRAIQKLEEEINSPLRASLSKAITALETMGFSERISFCEKHHDTHKSRSSIKSTSKTKRHFQTGGKGYAQYRPTYPPELAKTLASNCSNHQLAVDVGCGNGQLSTLLADHFKQVIASDISEDQLANAASRPNIHYRHEAAESISIDDNTADLIIAAQAAHWFDLPRFYSEVRRISKPGAILALISYGVPHIEGAANPCFQRFYWQKTTPFWPPERQHVETAYAKLSFPFELLRFPELSIQRDWNFEQLMGYLKTWSATQRAFAEGQSELLNEFGEELATTWGAPETQRRVSWPIAVKLGRL